jgi:hypothetical protein
MKLLGAKLRGIFAKFSEAPATLLADSAEAATSAAKAGRHGYGGFSSPSFSHQAARYVRRRRIKSNTIPANVSSEKHARVKKQNNDKSTSYTIQLRVFEVL